MVLRHLTRDLVYSYDNLIIIQLQIYKVNSGENLDILEYSLNEK